MKTIDKHFERFVDFLEEQILDRNLTYTYREVCERCGIPYSLLDVYLFDNFGLTGEQIVTIYCTRTPLPFLERQTSQDPQSQTSD